MKNLRFLSIPQVLIVLMLSASVTCLASPKRTVVSVLAQADSTLCAKIVNDSISNIIAKARKVSCRLLTVDSKDSVQVDTVKSLSSGMKNILRYLLMDPSNQRSNDIVYGVFSPSVSYRFSVSSRRTVYLELDFGLKKWRILDVDYKELQMGDMKKNNIQFLRLSRIVFPTDKYLKLLNDNLNLLEK